MSNKEMPLAVKLALIPLDTMIENNLWEFTQAVKQLRYWRKTFQAVNPEGWRDTYYYRHRMMLMHSKHNLRRARQIREHLINANWRAAA